MAINWFQPWWLLLLPLGWGWVVYWRRTWWQGRLPGGREKWILGIRLVLVSLIILALAGTRFLWPERDQRVVFLLDKSASSSHLLDQAEQFLSQAWQTKGQNDQGGVISFGENAAVEQPLDINQPYQGIARYAGEKQTLLAPALRLALGFLPDRTPSRVVLLSDGRVQDGEQALLIAQQMKASGLRLDIVPLLGSPGPEVILTDLQAPASTRVGADFNLTLRVLSSLRQQSNVLVYINERLVVNTEFELSAGENEFVLLANAGDLQGMMDVGVDVQVATDTWKTNNHASALVNVRGLPRILMVTGDEKAAENISRGLAGSGIDLEVRRPPDLPMGLNEWQGYEAVFLVDINARDLGERTMLELDRYVSDLGGGLITIGGPESYGPGGYFQSPLEKVLPVDMDFKDKTRIPKVGIMLVLDKSGSMSGDPGKDSMTLVKKAALLSIRSLRPEDTLGVLAFDSEYYWAVPFGPLGDGEAAQYATWGIIPSGGTSIHPALEEAINVLSTAQTDLKHIILLTDGHEARSPDYRPLVQRMEAQGITLSTVAVGLDASAQLLESLAVATGGRFYFTDVSEELPQIFAQETNLATRPFFTEESFLPAASPHQLLTGVDLQPLQGYIVTSLKSMAESPLTGPQDDPVLAAWQYGLGRVVSWTSDAAGRWSVTWLGHPSWGKLLGNILAWVLPAEKPQGMQIELTANEQGNLDLTVTDDDLESIYPGTAALEKGGARWEVKLNPWGPGIYRASVGKAEPGIYLAQVTLDKEGGPLALAGGTAIPYSPEYRYMGSDPEFLEKLATAGGGSILAEPDDAFAGNLPVGKRVQDISGFLLLLATLLLPVDIAIRRFLR